MELPSRYGLANGRAGDTARLTAVPRQAPRGSRGLSGIVESATAHDFPSARTESRAGRIDLNSARKGAGPILTPFHDLPFHVVQSPGIRKFLPDGVRHETTVQRTTHDPLGLCTQDHHRN